MSRKVVWWAVLGAMALATVVLFNYWVSYQPLSTLAYTGIFMAVGGLANLALPFRFLGIRKRRVGALIFAGGVGLAVAALLWPAPIIRVAQRRTCLDNIMPEYHFFGDMKSLVTLLKIRGAVLRIDEPGKRLQDMRVLDAFSASGYFISDSEQEIVMFGIANPRAGNRPEARTWQQFATYREQAGVKMAIAFEVENAAGGWSTISRRHTE